MIRLTRLSLIGLIGSILTAVGAETERLPAVHLEKAINRHSISIPTPRELIAALGRGGKDKLGGPISRPDADDLSESRANRAQPRGLDRRWVYCSRSKGQPAGQEYRVRHHQTGKSARSK